MNIAHLSYEFETLGEACPGRILHFVRERDGRGVLPLTDSAFFSTAEKHNYESESASNSGMVMIVAILVGVLGTVAIGLIVAVIIITRRRSISGKGASLIVAEEM